MTDEPHRIVNARGTNGRMTFYCACGAWLDTVIDSWHEMARERGELEGLQVNVLVWLKWHARGVDELWWLVWETAATFDGDFGTLQALQDSFICAPGGPRLEWWCNRLVGSHDVDVAAELLVSLDRLALRIASAREKRERAKRHGLDEKALEGHDWNAWAGLSDGWIGELGDAANQVLEGRAHYVHSSTRSSLDAPDTTPALRLPPPPPGLPSSEVESSAVGRGGKKSSL